jgi:DNA-binding transcriptional regulator YdaS (Cro superfamily)
MEKTTTSPGLAKAMACYPTLKAFAEALGTRYQVVQQWQKNGVPASYCPKIEELTGVLSEEFETSVDFAYIRSSHTRTPRL